MGWQVGSICYPTEVAANTAAASAELGRVVTMGGNSYVTDIGTVTATTVQYRFRGFGTSDQYVVKVITPQPCGLIELTDAAALGWLVVGAWCLTYCGKFLARVFHRNFAGEGASDDA